MPRKLFTSLRAGLEATPGTPVSPTRFLEWSSLDPTRDIQTIRPVEYRQSKFGYYRAAAGREENAVKFGGNLSFNQAAWLGQVFVKGGVTGTAGTSDYTYTYTPTAATDDLKRATLEYGYESSPSASQPAFQLAGAVGTELTINFDKESAEGVTFEATLASHKGLTDLSAYTGSPTNIASVAATPNDTSIYIDDTGGTIGTTQDVYCVSAEWKLSTPFTRLYTLDGGVAAQDNLLSDVVTWELALVRYFNDDNELNHFVDKEERLIRIETTGPALGSAAYRLTLDCYAVCDTAPWQESNGLWMQQLNFKPIYNSGAATDYEIEVCTAETSIT